MWEKLEWNAHQIFGRVRLFSNAPRGKLREHVFGIAWKVSPVSTPHSVRLRLETLHRWKTRQHKEFPGKYRKKPFPPLPTSRPFGLGLHCLYPWQLLSSMSCTCSWFKMPRSTVCTVFVSCGRRGRDERGKLRLWLVYAQQHSSHESTSTYLIRICIHIKILQKASGELTEEKIMRLVDCPQTPVGVVVRTCAGTERPHWG